MQRSFSMSPYAPIRYRDTFWWQFTRDAAQHGAITPSGQIAYDLPDRIMQSLCQPAATIAAEQFKDQPDGPRLALQVMAKMMELRHWVPLAGQFELCGRQIFDLTDDLVEMLAVTDIGDCTLEGWHAPYDAFFVRFGPQSDIKLPFDDGFEYLDGAFVAVTPWGDMPGDRRIKFGFTTVHQDGSGVDMPGYFLDLNPAEQAMPILDGIAASIERRVASMRKPDESPSALDVCRRGMLEEAQTLMQQAILLLVNALFYIESTNNKKGDTVVEPGRDTPVDQVVAWAQAQPAKRAKLRSRMTADGYVLVHLLGKELQFNRGAKTGGTVRSHWRRGHWRQQRVGPQRAQVERRWIKPTMVNADRPHDEIPGHVYVVGNSNGGASLH